MKTEFITALHRRIANTSVGPSTARGMGPKGTIFAARDYLASLNLDSFNKQTKEKFMASLNKATEIFLEKLPAGAQHWGAARKFLNVFLRGIIYNRFLCETYKLYHIEPWLEVPLDSHVANGLRLEPGGSILPRWRTVIGLDNKTNQNYQEFASEVAKRKGVHRVHLDLIYWRSGFIMANKRLNRDAE